MSVEQGTCFEAAVSTTLWSILTDQNKLMVLGRCTGAPPATANIFQHGCLIIRSDSGAGNAALYENTGTSAAPVWNLVGSIAAGEIVLADGKLLIGGADGVAHAQTPAGDVTITNAGVTAIGAKKVLASMIATADAKILIGGADGATHEQTPSGDVAMSNAGAFALAGAAKTLLNGLRTWLADGLFAIGTITVSGGDDAKFKTTTTAIYNIAGLPYSKAATDALTFSAADTINTAAGAGQLWGIWLVQINAAGVISTKPAAADMTYANEAAAIAALPAVDAGNAQLGYITVQAKEATDWVANTDNLTAGGGAGNCVARNFYDLPGAKVLPAALA